MIPGGVFPGGSRRALTKVKNPPDLSPAGSGGGQRFGAGRIAQAHAARHDVEHSLALQLGECPAYGFNAQTEIVGYVEPAYRKWHGGRRAAELAQPLAPADQKGRNLFLR